MKKSLFLITALSFQICSFSQNQQIPDPGKKPDWWGNIEGYINQQDKVILQPVPLAIVGRNKFIIKNLI